MNTRGTRLAVRLALAVLAATVAGAEENAALRHRGARIHLTCRAPTPLNTRWTKPEQMLAKDKPAGPIINDLTTAEITVSLPVPLTVARVGIRQGDYRGTFAMAKDISISAPGQPAQSFALAPDEDKLQIFSYAARTDTITVRVSSVYPPKSKQAPRDRTYGTIRQVQVLVNEDLDTVFAVPATYRRDLPRFVMRTANLDPGARPRVIGQPRKAEGHPCTIWDREDIAGFKREIATQPRAREAFERTVAFCEQTCAAPLSVPDEPDGGDTPAINARHNAVTLAIANLGIGYALSGNEAYAREARRLLLELAKRYEGWPRHSHPRLKHDSAKWSWQRLGEAIWLIPCAWGFDLIHDSPALTDADRATIVQHFVMPCVRSIMSSPGFIKAPTNWSAVGAAAVMIGARVAGDREYYEKSYMGLTRDMKDRNGGLFYHLDHGIDDDGMWAEGSLGYQFMAIRGLLVMAEILWHDGIDAYGYRDARLKDVFDSPIWYGYPGGRSCPTIHDGGHADLLGRDAHLWQYAKRRYGDPTYDAILSHVTPTFESVYNLFLPACSFADVNAADLPAVPSILFPGVGFAVTRHGDGDASQYLILDYGPNRSHGHPDKLNFCLYALGREWFKDTAGPGFYDTAVYRRYTSHSLAHNTVTANEMSQIMTGGRLEVYGSTGPLGVIRASCAGAVPAAILDRTLFVAGDRLYDIFLVQSGIPFTFDLPYHGMGRLEQALPTEPWKEHPKGKDGYCFLKDPVAAPVAGAWTCSWQSQRGRVAMHYLGEPGTELIAAETPQAGDRMVMVRRKGAQTVYACVMDLIGAGATATVKAVRRYTDPALGGYAIETELASGATELLMVTYAGTRQTFGGWQTDARVAFVRFRAGEISDVYMAGGSVLEGPAGGVKASAPALLACHAVKDGLSRFVNQTDAAATVTLAGFAAPDAVFPVEATGARGKPVTVTRTGSAVEFALEPRRAYELVRGSQPTIADYERGIRRARLAAMLAREEAERKAFLAEVDDQYRRAKAFNTPDDAVVLIQAEKPAAEGGGKVTISGKKAAAYGESFLNWDKAGHWLDYTVDVPAEGGYQVILKYCREGGPVTRALQIDGEYPGEPARAIELPGTGGWSNGTDNWRLHTVLWPLVDKPFLVHLKPGPHTVRLTNVSGGGVNLDYIVLAAPFAEITRQTVEQ
ncbi:MAG: heparinase II/III family protein [Kiritimatiellae bacterium]|nr:heparinase II/III family protein [Kiritimatiellia bacterium]